MNISTGKHLPAAGYPPSVMNGKNSWLLSTIAALGVGVLFGFDTAIISGAIPFITSFFQLEEWMPGWAVSSLLIGCGLGAMMAGKPADAWGRKKVLFACAFLLAISGVGVTVSNTLFAFVLFRIAGGMAVGAAAMVVPMYIAETDPAVLHGRMVALYQLAIVAGILLAYIVNYSLAGTGNNAWKWMFAAQVIPAVLFLIALIVVLETPRWLIRQGLKSQALLVLIKSGGQQYAEKILHNIRQNVAGHAPAQLPGLWQPAYKKVVFMGIVIAVFQPITGINAILNYAPEILTYTGVSTADASLQTIVIGLVMFLFTLVAIRWVDSTGRRKLLLTGSAAMVPSLVVVAAGFYLTFYRFYITLAFLMEYIAGFSASLGAVTWVILSEIFPNSIRGLALPLATLILWMEDVVASFSFPVLSKQLGTAYTLLVFAAFCLVYYVYLLLNVPETKGKTWAELETRFVNQN